MWSTTKRTISRICELCSAIQSPHKQVFRLSNGLVVLSTCLDAEILRFGDFCANNRRQTMTNNDRRRQMGQTDHFTPCTCAWDKDQQKINRV